MERDSTGQPDLHGYIDGEFDPEQTRAMAARVAASPALAREAAEFAADKALLKQVYGPLADRQLPENLRAPFHRARARRRVKQVAAAAALAASIAFAAWFGPVLLAGDRVVSEALAMREATGGVAADSLSSEARDQLLQTALDAPVKAPDLGRDGFRLATITIGKHAAQLGYRDASGRLFTVYLRPSLGADRFDIHEEGKRTVCVWQNAELAVAMVGEMPAREMLKLASASYADLNL